MPPILSFVNSSSVKIRTGIAMPDDNAVQVVQTGLDTPILFFWILADYGAGACYDVFKTITMPGRGAMNQNGVSFTGGSYGNVIGFVNGGVDFDIRNDDDLALNDDAGQSLPWIAFG